jgi:hypothetical protein
MWRRRHPCGELVSSGFIVARGAALTGGYPGVCAKSALMTAGDGESCARFVGEGCQIWFPPPMLSCRGARSGVR